MALQWQRIALPLNAGLQTRHDPRALEPPALTRCLNAEFTDLGGIVKRKPYASIGTAIAGGGTLADIRRITTYRDELVCFTKDRLYSRSEADSAWQDRGSHLAPKVTERSVFTRTSEQIDADRAELDGVTLYTWAEKTGASSNRVLAAARDSETGAVMAGPIVIDESASRPRVMALDSVFVLLLVNGTNLETRIIDPADLAGTIDDAAADTLALDTVHTNRTEYDVARLGAKLVGVTSRHFDAFNDFVRTFEVDAAGAITVSANVSRPSEGPVAIAARGDETTGNVLVVRIDGDAVEADLLDQDLADVSVNIAVGNVQSSGSSLTASQITAAWRSVAESGGETRCYVYWAGEVTADSHEFELRQNYVDDAGTAGTAADLVTGLDVASHAFDHDGQTYVWGVFAGSGGAADMGEPLGIRTALQNTYFLYRDDGELVAVAAPNVAGGFAQSDGHLPGVQDLGGNRYAWAGIERRIIPLGENQTGYAARAPLDIVLELDADDARRLVKCGETAYIAGGMVLQYDGEGLAELGFHIFPWSFAGLDGGASTGDLDAGTYTWKVTWAWENAVGELDRSAVASAEQLTASADAEVQLTIATNSVTRKTDPRSEHAVEVWRTQKDAGVGSPFRLVTDKDPSVTGGDNRYLENDPDAASGFLSTFVDSLADSDLIEREPHPPAAELENLAPPPASIIAATTDRVFLAGLSHRPNTIAYSKLRKAGEVVSFHEALRVDVPDDGGPITALAFLNETLIAFCERAVYAVPGVGFDNLGQGANYGPARTLAMDVGARSQEALAVTPQGVVFHSEKGWHIVDRGFNVRYIGAPVARFDSDTFVAVHALENEHQIRCLSTSRALVFDTVAEQWSEWTISDAVGACIWQGRYHYATADDVLAEQDDHALADYSIDIETAWIKLAGAFQGYAKLRRVWLLGEFRSAHDVRIRVGKDYDEAAYVDDKTWTATPATVGGPLRVRYGVSQPKGSAFRIRITDQAVGEATAPTGEALRLTGLDLEIGIKRGGHKLSAGRKF